MDEKLEEISPSEDGKKEVSATDGAALDSDSKTPQAQVEEKTAKAELPSPQLKPVSSLIGRILDGKYKVIEKLGEGGMGSVYSAEHLLMNRKVALKVLHPAMLSNEDSLKRFLHEARVASKLSHQNAVTMYDFGVDQSVPYIAMEFLDGKTLKQIIADEGALPISRVLPIFEQVCSVLADAHNLGIVHRDMKPDNIMLKPRPDGRETVTVLDFGIAKMLGQDDDKNAVVTRTGSFFGTPQYMSPEAATNQPDVRSDIYSLGIILYEALSGDVPFKAPSIMQLLILHMNEKPLPLRRFKPQMNISPELDAVVLKALEKDPARRYQTAVELLEDLRAAAASSLPAPEPESKQRSPVKGILAAGLAAVCVLLGAYFLASYPRPPKPPLVEPADAGLVTIRSVPQGAAVYLNDKQRGRTPLLLKGLKAGEHIIVLQKEGFEDLRVPLVLTKDESRDLPLTLAALSRKPQLFENEDVQPERAADASHPVETPIIAETPAAADTPVAAGTEVPSASPEPSPESSAAPSPSPSPSPVAVPKNPAAARELADKYFRQGEALLGKKNYAEAAEKYELALQYSKNHLEARLSLGLSYLRLRRFDDSLKQFTLALAADKSYAPTHYNLACYYALTGQGGRALGELREAVKLYPRCASWAAVDDDFASIRNWADFKRLTGSRAAGE